jgi:hypothetical protein
MSDYGLIQNAVYVEDDDTFYVSSHRHDFVTFLVNGGESFIDGGHEYSRMGGRLCESSLGWQDYRLTKNDSDEVIREKLLWGVLRNGKTVWLPIKELTVNHLKNIVNDVKNGKQKIGSVHLSVIEYWLDQKS